ncbi:hypothetical protein BB560_005373 [Smittium megazygosporum]|uniref:Uncharacterized protein n=1 Tax=Smittium megazygosporum TaxID=133381 RepID=A0A2T9Z6S8_9FUNG|nr:hypothetical protein BB560_005373 [Smittium megazygosporum]
MDSQEKDLQEQALIKCSLDDAVMDKETAVAAKEYITNSGAPFNLLRALVDGYKGFAPTTNQLASDFDSTFNTDSRPILYNAIKQSLATLVEKEKTSQIFDSMDGLDSQPFKKLKLDIEGNLESASVEKQKETQDLTPADQDISLDQTHINDLLSEKELCDIVCELAVQYPKSKLLSRISGAAMNKGLVPEPRSVVGASSNPDMFYEMVISAVERLTSSITGSEPESRTVANTNKVSADDSNISDLVDDLWNIVGFREHTYFLAMYILHEARKLGGERAYPIQRIIEELENRVYKQFDRPIVATHIKILLEGLPIDGNNPISLALTSILQSERASPGDVVTLYKVYHDSKEPPPTKILRDTVLIELLLKEVFWFLSDDKEKVPLQPDLQKKYLWLVAHGTTFADKHDKYLLAKTNFLSVLKASNGNSVNEESDGIEVDVDSQIEELKGVLVENREKIINMLEQACKELVPVNIMINFNKKVAWLLEASKVPIVAMLIIEWARAMLTANNYSIHAATITADGVWSVFRNF